MLQHPTFVLSEITRLFFYSLSLSLTSLSVFLSLSLLFLFLAQNPLLFPFSPPFLKCSCLPHSIYSTKVELELYEYKVHVKRK